METGIEDLENLISHRPRLVRIAASMLHNATLAEDCADAAIGRAFVYWKQHRNTGKLDAWLNSILKNICYHHLRNEAVHERHWPLLFRNEDRRSPFERAIGHEIEKAFKEALDTITEKQRQAFLWSELDGLPHETTAERLGLRPGAVRALVFRARRALAGSLGKYIA